MSEATTVSIRIDRKVKNEAQELFNALGMDMTTAINVFLRQAIITGGLPFKVQKERTPSRALLAAMKEAKELAKDPNAKRYDNLEELFEDLHAL